MPPSAAPVMYKTVEIGGGLPKKSKGGAKARFIETGNIAWVGPKDQPLFNLFMLLMHVSLWVGAIVLLSIAMGNVGNLTTEDANTNVLVSYLSFVAATVVYILFHIAYFGQEHALDKDFKLFSRVFYLLAAICISLGLALNNGVSSLHYQCLSHGSTEAEWLCNLDPKHCGSPSSPPSTLTAPPPSPASSTSSGRMLSDSSTTFCLGGKVGDYPVNDTSYWILTMPFYLILIGTFFCITNLTRMKDNQLKHSREQPTSDTEASANPPGVMAPA